jgi:crossover junction endodeoxyribonuclease RuvC
LSIAGNGAASKQQIQRMVQQLLGLKVAPDPLDVSDALAVALCHIHRRRKIQ